MKFKACVVKLLPASEGTGLKAGSSIRSVLELAGYSNILSKMVGSNNKLNNALATIKALSAYKHADYFVGLKTAKVAETAELKAPAQEAESTAPVEEKKAPAKKAPAKKASVKKAEKED